MPVKKPKKVLMSNVPLKFVAKKVAGGSHKSVDSSIPLVPFIDFLITLVVFLITSFSASGELIAQKPSITMPDAKNTIQLEIAPILAVDARVLTLDGLQVAETPAVAALEEGQAIDSLVKNLETLKRNWGILHASEPFPGTLVLQADKAVDFVVVKKIMFSASKAGYANVSFAVNQRGGE